MPACGGYTVPMVVEGPTVPTMPAQPFRLCVPEINIIPGSTSGLKDPGITSAATVNALLLPEMEQPRGHTLILDLICAGKDTLAAIDSAWCCTFPFNPGHQLEEPQ